MIVALLLAAPLQNGLMAVLEFKNKLKKEEADVGYLSDEVRSAALKALPGLRVITRENMLVLMQSAGKKLEDCEGECEVDTGRRIGADMVVSGELLKFGTAFKLDLKLHDTAEGRLIAGSIASGKTIDELDANVPAAVNELLAPLKAQSPPKPAPQAAAPPPAATPPPATPVPQAPAGAVMRVEKKSGLSFIRIAGGTAHLGCATGDKECRKEEKPPRTAQVKDFWMGRTEVTVQAYAACAAAKACSDKAKERDVKENAGCNWANDRMLHPMNCVSERQAEVFCKWAGGRLPTAAEWEYAAKSGEDVIYPWGNAPPTGKHANFCDVNCRRAAKNPANADKKADTDEDDGWAGTAPVGSYPAGATKWGLLDMAGNVAEWTSTDWGEGKELHGGNWSAPIWNLRVSHRVSRKPGFHNAEFGFRCAQ